MAEIRFNRARHTRLQHFLDRVAWDSLVVNEPTVSDALDQQAMLFTFVANPAVRYIRTFGTALDRAI